mgnify:CR=1 FL=1
MTMALHNIDHPLARTLISQLRDKDTTSEAFRAASYRITQLLVIEATRTLPTTRYRLLTPLEETEGHRIDLPITLVPIIRAGISMVEPTLGILPHATVGYIGLERDEETAIARSYYQKLPNQKGQKTFIIDPMLATGGSTLQTIDLCKENDATDITVISVISAPEGVSSVLDKHPDVNIFTAALDRELNVQKFILPGLGDFGDRLYNT